MPKGFALRRWHGVAVAANGFAVRHEATVDTTPAKAYEAFVAPASRWDPEHTYSGDARNLRLDARAGGCFCGALGPLQAHGVSGGLTLTAASAPGSTKIALGYIVGGFVDGDFDKLAPAVARVFGTQFQRLKAFVDTGKPAPGR